MYRILVTLAATSVALSASPVFAQSATSSGYALNLQQNVTAPGVATVNVGIGPLAATSGSAPPSYNVTNTVASVNQSFALTSGVLGIGAVGENVGTGILSSTSSGSADAAQATATIDNASFAIGTTLLNSLFNLGATTIRSTSQANSVGGLDASGATTIEGLTIGGTALAGLTFDASVFINPAPNTILLNVGGLSIVLNEQILSGDGLTGIGITTNAIHAAFNGFPVGTGLANGNLILGHSQAFASVGQPGAVPEPSTWAMMLIGFGAAGYSLRRKNTLAVRPQTA